MAHELNNILGAVGGFAAMLERHVGNEQTATHAYEELLRTCERASSITRKVLSLGRGAPSPVALVDLSALVRDMEPLLRQLVPERVRLTSRIPPELPRVAARALDLELVLLNLVVNARDAIEGPGSIEIRACLGEEGQGPGERRVVLTVRDSGRGMEPDVLSKAFEPFFTTKPAGSGTGLGLALAREALMACGASIEIGSEPGAGTLVTMGFRAAEERVDSRFAIILCMEPGETRALASALVRRRGFEVFEADTYDDARALLAAHRPRLVAKFVDAAIGELDARDPHQAPSHARVVLQRPLDPSAILEALDTLTLPASPRNVAFH